MSSNNWKFTLGVITGAVAGIFIYRHRKQIGKVLNEIADGLMEFKDMAVESMEHVKDSAIEKAEHLKNKLHGAK